MSDWHDKRVVVTGGAGFIGSHLVEQLVAGGALVTAVDDLSTGHLENLRTVADRMDLCKTDIRELDWGRFLGEQTYDSIFHLAANAYVPPSVKRPAWDFEINLQATFRLLEALREVGWPGTLIYASSAAVYGNPARIPIREDDPTTPISPYGTAKLAAERYVAVYGQLYGIRTASLRFFSVYGPRQRKQVVYDFLRKLGRDSSELFIYGDGTQVRDFNYVEDAVRAALLVWERGKLAGEVYNVASGKECSIRELAERLCGALDVQPRLVYSGSVRPGDAEKWSVDIGRLTAVGYRPQISIDEGLKRTVAWYRSLDER